jgi:hypothetical protein
MGARKLAEAVDSGPSRRLLSSGSGTLVKVGWGPEVPGGFRCDGMGQECRGENTTGDAVAQFVSARVVDMQNSKGGDGPRARTKERDYRVTYSPQQIKQLK